MTIITCNGCFGVPLHPGHLFFLGYTLAQARDDKDVGLVVGINSDAYIRRKKKYEPAPEEQRAKELMDLGFILKVEIFFEENPGDFIRRVRPNIHCTGAEYVEDCPEKIVCDELGIKLVFVPRIGPWSTRKLKGMLT